MKGSFRSNVVQIKAHVLVHLWDLWAKFISNLQMSAMILHENDWITSWGFLDKRQGAEFCPQLHLCKLKLT